MNIIESIMINNPCFKSGRKINVRGLMLHSVGTSQPKASVFINQWNRESFNAACVHAFIDGLDGNVYQTLPWDTRGWHCGASGNDTHIGVEMCEPDCITYTGGSSFSISNMERAREIVGRTYRSAVELFAMLCKKYNLDPLGPGVIVSHKEGHDIGIATDHKDPEHLWMNIGGYTMDAFRRAVKMEVNRSLYQASQSSVKPTSTSNFVVKVDIPNLNIRKGPGTNYDKTGAFTGVGAFTIINVKSGIGSTNGWGELKSGKGWISLDFCKRIG